MVIPNPRKRAYIMAYTIRTDPDTMLLDCNSSDPHRMVYPGKMRAMDDCAIALKQKIFSPLIEMLPNALAMKLVNIATTTSKTCENSLDLGVKNSWKNPRRIPSPKLIGQSIGRASNAKGPTQTDANPYTRIRSQSV